MFAARVGWVLVVGASTLEIAAWSSGGPKKAVLRRRLVIVFAAVDPWTLAVEFF